MVGLVLVSHSRSLAEAVCRLAKGVSDKPLPIAFAGGAGEGKQDLGTDATDIMDAIQSVDAGDGVVVLMDLGSAVISSRMAAELLDGQTANIRLCSAPLVEGAVAAAVQLGLEADLDAICREASQALSAKRNELDGEASSGQQPQGEQEAIPADALRLRFVLDDPHGLHVRPAAALVKALAGPGVHARLRNFTNESPFVDARSLNQVALSNIGGGMAAELALWGPQAQDAAERVRTMLRTAHPGREIAANAGAPAKDGAPSLQSLSPGIAIGTLYRYDQESAEPLPVTVDDAEKEIVRFDAALDAVEQELRALQAAASSAETADILGAHLLILRDATLLDPVRQAVRRQRQDAASAYWQRTKAMAGEYKRLDNPYMAERAADVEGVAAQVQEALSGKSRADAGRLADVVLWAGEVTPAQIGAWRREQLAGVLTLRGDRSSHAAILARSLGVPMLAGVALPAGAETGDAVVVDADAPEVSVKPDAGKIAALRARRGTWLAAAAREKADGQGEAVSKDGITIAVCANVSYQATAQEAFDCGADGIGVLRSEFLYLETRRPPSEDEQTAVLSGIFSIFKGKPITARTLDVGGDKHLPWLEQAHEANPFLGVRGVRLTLRRREFFKGQLRAFLRAGRGHELEILLPMISLPEEVDEARALLDECQAELAREGREHASPVRLGIMLETPASAMLAEELAARADFFSAGTNDLTQYVMCAERGNRELASLSDSLHPAVLRTLRIAIEAAKRHGTEFSVCGEMAGDPLAAKVLLGMGVTHFSMNPAAIGRIKRLVRESDVGRLRQLGDEACSLKTAAEVRRLAAEL